GLAVGQEVGQAGRVALNPGGGRDVAGGGEVGFDLGPLVLVRRDLDAAAFDAGVGAAEGGGDHAAPGPAGDGVEDAGAGGAEPPVGQLAQDGVEHAGAGRREASVLGDAEPSGFEFGCGERPAGDLLGAALLLVVVRDVP